MPFCTNCGDELSGSGKFCSNCGQASSSTPNDNIDASNDSKSNVYTSNNETSRGGKIVTQDTVFVNDKCGQYGCGKNFGFTSNWFRNNISATRNSWSNVEEEEIIHRYTI